MVAGPLSACEGGTQTGTQCDDHLKSLPPQPSPASGSQAGEGVDRVRRSRCFHSPRRRWKCKSRVRAIGNRGDAGAWPTPAGSGRPPRRRTMRTADAARTAATSARDETARRQTRDGLRTRSSPAGARRVTYRKSASRAARAGPGSGC